VAILSEMNSVNIPTPWSIKILPSTKIIVQKGKELRDLNTTSAESPCLVPNHDCRTVNSETYSKGALVSPSQLQAAEF
jgi:hypothetical protein